jgi:hypothetical protein
MVVTAPVLAEEPSVHVSYSPIGFDLPAALGTSADLTSVPATSPDDVVPYPPRLVVTIYGERNDLGRVPRVGAGPSVLTAFRIADTVGLETVARHVDTLRAILADRPDLSAFTTDRSVAFPFLPARATPQLIRARPTYVDTPTVSGIGYLTAFEQAGEGGPLDSFPFTSTSVIATFQGISSDGRWYVSFVQELETSLFPAQPTARDIRRAAAHWDAYLEESVARLEAAPPADFTPSLDAVDALVRSLAVEAPSSGVSPSPAPSATPGG